MDVRRYLADTGKRTGTRISVGLNLLFGNRSSCRFGILMYHRVAAKTPGLSTPTWNVTPERFRAQIEGVISRGYQFWPLRKVIDRCVGGGSVPSRVAVITFDDGYENVYLNAWPILKKLQVPATIFVATAYLDGEQPFPFDDWDAVSDPRAPSESWRPLTWRQCQEMESSGLIEFGSHTHRHEDFRGKPEELKRDIRRSLALLGERLDVRQRTFAFPYGGRAQGFSAPQLAEAARQAGVSCALTTDITLNDPDSSPFGWGRIEVVEADGDSAVVAKLEGWYNWMARGRQLFRTVARPAPGQAPRWQRMSES